ncbi:MAG: class I SAM-dependent methyltransferase [Acidimicrobiales bacterium]
MTTTDRYTAQPAEATTGPDLAPASGTARPEAGYRNPNNDTRPAVAPQPLLRRARLGSPVSPPSRWRAVGASAARSVVLRLLERMKSDTLVVVESNRRHRFGGNEQHPHKLSATVTIIDDRAWAAILREGSIGLGRGYIEGWWHSDDPTSVVQILIRNLHGLDDVRNRVGRLTGAVGDGARRAMPRNSRRRNREEIGAHYNLGNEFFRLFLDETMTYSAGVFANGLVDLKAASLAKYDRLVAKLGVGPQHDVLEIGTGWGGMAIRTAEQRGAFVTTTTVSDRQLEETEARLARSRAGNRVELLNRDWRDLSGTFDRIVSIEMIEAVDWRDYNRFFSTIEDCLAADGMVGLQAICVPDRRYERAKNTEDFIRRFVFPGGFLPSIGALARSVGRATRLQILDIEDLSAHYAETLRRWRHRFDDRLDEVQALGLDDRFCRLWRFYLAYCEAGFLERHCTVNQIVLVGPEWRPDGLGLRPV